MTRSNDVTRTTLTIDTSCWEALKSIASSDRRSIRMALECLIEQEDERRRLKTQGLTPQASGKGVL